MQGHSKDNVEFALAKSVLEEASENKEIKKMLYQAALVVDENIYKPIIQALKEARGDIEKVPPHIKAAAMLIIEEHSSDERQELGVLRYHSANELIKEKRLVELFEKLQANLLKVKNAHSLDDIQHSLKSLANACWGYVEKFPIAEDKKSDFDIFKKTVMPSTEEGLSRIKNAEMGSPYLAMTEKSGKKTLIDKKDAPTESFVTGRSMFFGVDLAKRLEFKANELDKVIDDKKKLENKISSLADKDSSLKENAENDLKQLNEKYQELYKFVCQDFHVPLDAKERKAYSHYVNPTFIERIAKTSDLSVVATSSGTAGRPLIALYHMDFFGKGKDFDFEKARLFSNCMSAFVVYGGHHTYIESVEPYNRLLDAAGIEYLKKNENADASDFTKNQIPVVEAGDPEDLLVSIHPNIRGSVEKRMEVIQKDLEKSGTPRL